MLVDRVLTRLEEELPGLSIERVDVLTTPGRTWRDGVRMIPALKAGKDILSGIILKEHEVQTFVERNLCND